MSAERLRLVSIQVGLPRDMPVLATEGGRARSWRSGIIKYPVSGPIRVGRTNLDGDGQADSVHHGGPDKAVLAYSADHYPAWRSELAEWLASRPQPDDFQYGAFGENLTVEGATEQEVCIGDIWRAGTVLLQVSQPRQPCWKLNRRWQLPQLLDHVMRTGRSGWYLRVLEPGIIQPGMDLKLDHRPLPEWTVDRVAKTRYRKGIDPAIAAELAQLPELSASWRAEFSRLARTE